MATRKNRYPKAQFKEVTLPAADTGTMQTLVGEFDRNIRTVEKELQVTIGRDATGLIIQGDDSNVDLAADLLSQMKGLIEAGEQLFPGDVNRSIRMLSANRKAKLQDLFRDQVQIAGRTHTVVPRTFKQKEYVDAIRSQDVVFGIGPAGTGKTYLAMAMAVSALLRKDVKRVVLCRPAVEAGEKLGFLPGDMAEKVNPYLRPLYDALHDMLDYERAKELVDKGMIEVAPLAFMRGRTLSNSFVILDEAQNTTRVQMKMLLTRIGIGSKCVVTGDVTQIDLPHGTVSGLHDAMTTLKNLRGLAFVHFSEQDVIRHPIVSDIVQAYERREKKEKEGPR